MANRNHDRDTGEGRSWAVVPDDDGKNGQVAMRYIVVPTACSVFVCVFLGPIVEAFPPSYYHITPRTIKGIFHMMVFAVNYRDSWVLSTFVFAWPCLAYR